jgi:hypothetical protein
MVSLNLNQTNIWIYKEWKNNIEQVEESTNMAAMLSHKFVMHLPP